MEQLNFRTCSRTAYPDNSEPEALKFTLQSLKVKCGIDELEPLLIDYINSEFHKQDDCPCENKNVGTILADCIRDTKFSSGYTGLHHAVSTIKPKPSFKHQAVSAFVESHPDLLFTTNRKEETPLMLAAWKNANIIDFLFKKYANEDNEQRFTTVNIYGDSVLTYSFKLRRTKSDSEDISLSLIKKYFKEIDVSTLNKAVKTQECPNAVITELTHYLAGSISLKELSDILGSLLQRNNMDSRSQFAEILKKVMLVMNRTSRVGLPVYSFKSKEMMYSDKFNILHELAKIVNGDTTNKDLLSMFYSTSFLDYNYSSCICRGDQKNMAHFACNEDNLFLLEVIAEKFHDDFLNMMQEYDSDHKRPAFYCRKPLHFVTKFGSENELIWSDLCKDNEYNIVHQIFHYSYKRGSEFENFLKLDNSHLQKLLQNCNRMNDSALHLMLQTTCKTKFLQMLVDKFKELQGEFTINMRNKKGMTPLHILCCNINNYDDQDDLLELLDILIKAGADVNAIVNPTVSGPIRVVTAEWLARMSIFTAKDPSLYDYLDEVLPIIRRSPQYCDDEEFHPDEQLFEKLISYEVVRHSQSFKLFNLIGPYTSDRLTYNNDSIVCMYSSELENTYYHCIGLKPDVSTTLIHPDCKLEVKYGSSVKKEDALVELYQRSADRLKSLSKRQIHLIADLKKKMGLSYLHLPQSWDKLSSEGQQPDKAYLSADEFRDADGERQLDILHQDLDRLSELGLIVRIRDHTSYTVVNIPFALTQWSTDTKLQSMFCKLGIPTRPTPIISTPKLCNEVLFCISLSAGAGFDKTSCNALHILCPIVDMLIYLLDGGLCSTSTQDSERHVLVFGKRFVELKLKDSIIEVTGNDKTIKDKMKYATEVAIKHLNHGNIGRTINADDSMMKMSIEYHDGSADTSSTIPNSDVELLLSTNQPNDQPTPTTNKVEVENIINTKLDDLSGGHLEKLFGKMKNNENIKMPIIDHHKASPEQLETAVWEVNMFRSFSLMANERNTTVMSFYKAIKQDPDNALFCEALLGALGLQDEHMRTRTDNCHSSAWWIVTGLVAAIIFIVTIVTSVLYDQDGGFGGLAGVPLVFIASVLLKQVCMRDAQGIYNPCKDDEIMKVCRGCIGGEP